MILGLLAGLVMMGNSADALMRSPYDERAAEITAIIQNQEVANALGRQPIESIIQIDDNLVEVAVGECVVETEIRRLPTAIPHFLGPGIIQVAVLSTEGCSLSQPIPPPELIPPPPVRRLCPPQNLMCRRPPPGCSEGPRQVDRNGCSIGCPQIVCEPALY
ncbi:MAG: hypothetical protein ACXWP5_02555 [Bdellovibrionota bacterium]